MQCPSCRQEFGVGHAQPGQRVACPRCGTFVAVPGQSQGPYAQRPGQGQPDYNPYSAPPGAAGGYPGQPDAYGTLQTVPGSATASLICGIIGLIVAGIILGVVALILGVNAKSTISQNPQQYTGSGRATAGIVLGVIDIVTAVIIIAVVMGG